MAQIGFLGGTFDPPHNGHLSLALSLMEAHGLEEVWFCPASTNPFKKDRLTTDPHHRLQMARLATQDIPQFHVLDVEHQREGVSYTIDTVRHLVAEESKKESPRQIRLLLGTDTAAELPLWREVKEIILLAPPLVGSRSGDFPVLSPEASEEIFEALEKGRTKIPLLDISSTEIRRRIRSRLFCGHLLPSKVVDYIYNHHLY
ncbi:MAG: nicotinate-nucleotide adenylyltransferase [Chlamydiales bacterium]|nr:nicotinate-nucleotide adenylyltransferase [Chlamydiales bacterium]